MLSGRLSAHVGVYAARVTRLHVPLLCGCMNMIVSSSRPIRTSFTSIAPVLELMDHVPLVERRKKMHDGRWKWRTIPTSDSGATNIETRLATSIDTDMDRHSCRIGRMERSDLVVAAAVFTDAFTRGEPLNATVTARATAARGAFASTTTVASALENRYRHWWELGLRTVYRGLLTNGIYGFWHQPCEDDSAPTLPILPLPSSSALDWWSTSSLPYLAPPTTAASTNGLVGIVISEVRSKPIVDADNFFRSTPTIQPVIEMMAVAELGLDVWLKSKAPISNDHILCISFGAVLPSYQHRGILRDLVNYTIYRQLESNPSIQLIYGICTSRDAARACERMGWRSVHTVPYETFEFPLGSGQFPFRPEFVDPSVRQSTERSHDKRHRACQIWVVETSRWKEINRDRFTV